MIMGINDIILAMFDYLSKRAPRFAKGLAFVILACILTSCVVPGLLTKIFIAFGVILFSFAVISLLWWACRRKKHE
jgi:hypothetical protein